MDTQLPGDGAGRCRGDRTNGGPAAPDPPSHQQVGDARLAGELARSRSRRHPYPLRFRHTIVYGRRRLGNGIEELQHCHRSRWLHQKSRHDAHPVARFKHGLYQENISAYIPVYANAHYRNRDRADKYHCPHGR